MPYGYPPDPNLPPPSEPDDDSFREFGDRIKDLLDRAERSVEEK